MGRRNIVIPIICFPGRSGVHLTKKQQKKNTEVSFYDIRNVLWFGCHKKKKKRKKKEKQIWTSNNLAKAAELWEC